MVYRVDYNLMKFMLSKEKNVLHRLDEPMYQ
jgi:hypothetical protein